MNLNKGDIFESRELVQGEDIDFELTSFFSEPVNPIEFKLLHKMVGKNGEEEAISIINKSYSIKTDPDIDLKTILDRKAKYHKEMVKFFKAVQQTRPRKLEDFLNETRISCVDEYAGLEMTINNEYYLGNYNLNALFIPVHNLRNLEDVFYIIYLLNDYIENERK